MERGPAEDVVVAHRHHPKLGHVQYPVPVARRGVHNRNRRPDHVLHHGQGPLVVRDDQHDDIGDVATQHDNQLLPRAVVVPRTHIGTAAGGVVDGAAA